MIVDDLNVGGTAWGPREANAVLVVDTDAVLPRAFASKRLQAVAGKRSEIGQALRNFQAIQPRLRLPRETGKLPDMFPSGEALGSPVAVADDHIEKTTRKLRFT